MQQVYVNVKNWKFTLEFFHCTRKCLVIPTVGLPIFVKDNYFFAVNSDFHQIFCIALIRHKVVVLQIISIPYIWDQGISN